MFHTIEFRADLTVDVALAPKGELEQVLIRKGTRVRTQLKPYVTESEEGPVEVADLFFEDGSATHAVPYASFSFVEGRKRGGSPPHSS